MKNSSEINIIFFSSSIFNICFGPVVAEILHCEIISKVFGWVVGWVGGWVGGGWVGGFMA